MSNVIVTTSTQTSNENIWTTTLKKQGKPCAAQIRKKSYNLFHFVFTFASSVLFTMDMFHAVCLIIFYLLVPPIVMEVISSPIITPRQQQEDIMISWMVCVLCTLMVRLISVLLASNNLHKNTQGTYLGRISCEIQDNGQIWVW